MIQFGILGPLEVLVAGEPVVLGGPRQRALLVRLLLDRARVVSSERLIEDVWDGRPPATAAKIVQKHVSELRRALNVPVLRTVAGGYVLDVDDDSLDAGRFERLVANHDYAAALAVWRGEVLTDLPDLAFVAPERARLDELRLFAIESRIEADLDAGRHGSVIGELAELVEALPLRERLTSQLMVAMYRSGRQVEALRAFERHRRHLADEIGVDPAAGLRELEDAILRQDPALDLQSVPGQPSRGNLLMALTSFVGRSADLEATARAVEENRLVTFIGPGGVGKTRLALELGARIADRFPGGVWMVDLAGVQATDRVADTTATALGVDTRHARDELTALTGALAHRPPTLVLLDNCEHVVESVAAVTVAILAAAENVRVLATSRRPLGVDGEYVRPIAPLAEGDAVRLFADRARLTAAGSEVASHHAFEICRKLDGLPLAIELVVSQLRVMDAEDIVARLDEQLTFRGPASGGSLRQRTLGDMVQWSHDVLAAPVRATFARLGVFASSLTLPAAEAVCAHGETTPRHVLGQITTLIDHSLLVRDQTAEGSSRYRLLETLRLFALDRLAEAGEVDSTRRSHADYFRTLAEVGGAHMYGPHERSWRIRLELEEPNLQAALAWCVERDPVLGVRLAVALWPYWDARWRERQGVDYIEDLLGRDLDLPNDLRAWALTASAAMSGNAGEARQTVPRAIEAVAAFRDVGDERGLTEALAALGLGLGNQGQLDDAERALTEGLAIARRLDDGLLIARVLDRLGFIAGRRGDHGRAAEINREELETLIALGSRRGEATALRHLAVSMQHLGADDEAAAMCHRALDIWKDLDDPAAIAHVQTTLADIARLCGDLADAVDIYNTALVDLQAIGDRRCTASTYKNLATVAAQRGDHVQAASLYHGGLVLRYELGDEAGLAEVLEGLACLNSADGRDEDAATLITAAAVLRERTGSTASRREADAAHQALDTGRRRLGDDRFETSVGRGREMSVAEIVDFALGTYSGPC